MTTKGHFDMSPADRCDEIIDLIDRVLGEAPDAATGPGTGPRSGQVDVDVDRGARELRVEQRRIRPAA